MRARGDVVIVLRWLDGGDPNARNDSFDGSSVSLLDCAAFAYATLVRELLARGAIKKYRRHRLERNARSCIV